MTTDKNLGLIISVVGLVGILILLVVAATFLPYRFSQLWEKKADQKLESVSIDTRYMFEINGIETPKDVLRQYKNHPEPYKFVIDDDWVVMYAYPDPKIRWIGMVFIHHIPSISEVVLDFDGNEIFEHITSLEVQSEFDKILNTPVFIRQLRNRMGELWNINDPGAEVLEFVRFLKIPGNNVEYLGGRPQTIIDAPMYLVRLNHQDVHVYEFVDEAARRKVSDTISPDGYEFTEITGEGTTVIHIEYLDQPNFWIGENILVQYLGRDNTIISTITTLLGNPITKYRVDELDFR